MIQIGDRFMLMPAFLGRDKKEDRLIAGTVLHIYPRRRFAIVGFGDGLQKARECIWLDELESAPRAPARKGRRK